MDQRVSSHKRPLLHFSEVQVTGYRRQQSSFNYGCINAALKGWDRDNSWERRGIPPGPTSSRGNLSRLDRQSESEVTLPGTPRWEKTNTVRHAALTFPHQGGENQVQCELNSWNCETSGNQCPFWRRDATTENVLSERATLPLPRFTWAVSLWCRCRVEQCNFWLINHPM